MTTLVPPQAAVVADACAGTTRWRWVAAATVVAAGALHVAAAFDNVHAGDVVVGFFLLVALLQLASGVWLAVTAVTRTGHAPWPVAAVLALTVGLLLLYLAAHTTDLLAGVAGTDHQGGAAAGTHEGAQAQPPAPTGPVALGLESSAAEDSPGLLGTATVTVELLSVLALSALLPIGFRRHAANGLLALGVLVWIVWFTGVVA
jgi:hypothetical protein